MNRRLKTDLTFLLKNARQLKTVIPYIFVCFCVSVTSRCVLVYMLTYAYECIRGTEVRHNENEK